MRAGSLFSPAPHSPGSLNLSSPVGGEVGGGRCRGGGLSLCSASLVTRASCPGKSSVPPTPPPTLPGTIPRALAQSLPAGQSCPVEGCSRQPEFSGRKTPACGRPWARFPGQSRQCVYTMVSDALKLPGQHFTEVWAGTRVAWEWMPLPHKH